MLIQELAYLAAASLPVACVAWTVCETELFSDLRGAIKSWACSRKRGRFSQWLCNKAAYLPTCYYCFSTWVAGLVIFLTDLRLLVTGIIGWALGVFTTVWFAAFTLTGYNILRAWLRGVKAWADRQEQQAKGMK